MAIPNMTISPALPQDLLPIARLESYTFYNDDFCALAFGLQRDSEANLERRANNFPKESGGKWGRGKITKAVRENERGEEEILGAAVWTFNIASEGKVAEEVNREDTDVEQSWGIGANIRLCEDAFLTAGKHMERSIEGKDHASEFETIFAVKVD